MIKLVSLNLERSKHLDRNIPFFQKERPDILCLQEVFEADIDHICAETGLSHMIWQKATQHEELRNGQKEIGYSGSAILSRYPFLETGSSYYYLPEAGIDLQFSGGRERRETNAQGILWVKIAPADDVFVVANTHFTWTPNGEPNEHQRSDFQLLEKLLTKLPAHILVGDLNAPRGNGMWEKFAALYSADNIPLNITTTLDSGLHRIKGFSYVVDALFSAGEYQVRNVRLVSGVSDHQAVVAEIGRV